MEIFVSQQADLRPIGRTRRSRDIPGYPWILLPHNLGLLLGRFLLLVHRIITGALQIARRNWRLLGVALGVTATLYAVTVVLGSDDAPEGTRVMGVDIGGLSRAEAADRLAQTWNGRSSGVIAVDAMGQSTTIPLSAINFDIPATVANASTNRWWPWDLASTFFGGSDVAPVMSVEPTAVDAAVVELERSAGNAAKEPEIVYDGLKPVVLAGREGPSIEAPQAAAAVVTAVIAGRSSVALPVVSVAPAVSRYEIDRVTSKLATTAVAAPVRLTVEGETIDITPEDLAAVVTFEADGSTLVPQVDGVALVSRIEGRVPGAVPPVEAKYEEVDGNPQVVPSTVGRGLDPAELASNVEQVLGATGANRRISMELTDLYPAAIPADLQAMGVTTEVSTFTQYFDPAEYRRINIGEASRRLNGTVVMPGEVFSMNDTVAERTVENGYTEGVVVGEGGVLTKDMGGGVSAATTATWTAAFFAGLEKVEQHAHSIYISRYTPGLEATVSWGNLDLKFRNNTDAPIYITSTADDSSMTVSMYGARRYDQVAAQVGEKRNFTQPGSTVASGSQCLPSSGIRGFDITVQRLFFQGGTQVAAEPFTTHYAPSPSVSCTG